MFSLLMLMSFAFAEHTLFISPYDYMFLTGSERRAYVDECRRATLDFELKFNEASPGFASLGLIPRAEADGADTCPVGGVFIHRRAGKCSTFGRNCGGRADGFLCGKLYKNACVDRQPVQSLSERCHQSGAGDLSPEEYAHFSSVVEQGYQRACTARRSNPGCEFMKQRMAAVNDHVRKPDPAPPVPPAPPKPNPDPKPDPKADDKFSAVKEGVCKRDRDQGARGTCHAFCLTCVYDNAMANATGKTEFKVSSNWISMLSVVKRVCDDPDSRDKLSDKLFTSGWYPESNLNSLAAFGACAETSYVPYRGAPDWAQQFRTKKTDFARPDPKLGLTRSLFPLRDFSEDEKKSWRDNFAIEPADAHELFCPGEKKVEDSAGDYEKRLERMKGKLSPQFVRCAEEGLRNKSRIRLPERTTAACESKPIAPGQQGVSDLKHLLHEANGPIPAVIKTSVDGHGYHCVTLTGYDDVKKVFTAVNSWGKSEQFNELPYAQQNSSLVYTTSANCAIVSNRKSLAPAGQGAASSSR